MVERIHAYKNAITGEIFSDEKRAIQSEFLSRMRGVGGSLPAMGSISSYDITQWFGDHIASGVYPTVFEKLMDALKWWELYGRATPVTSTNHSGGA